MFDKAFRLIKEITSLEAGSTAFIVGGAVRDYLLGKECDDIDIATSVSMDKLENVYETVDIGANKDFGILVIKYEGVVFEVASYRSDGDYSDCRHPNSVTLGVSVYEDSCRRDFTINSMYMDSDKNIVDHHGGQEDLKNGIIKSVGNPKDRFLEDALRMVRCCRFSAVLNFDIDRETFEAMCNLYQNITFVSYERIWKELWKMASSNNFTKGVCMLKECGILSHILPEIDCMDKYFHYPKHHPEGATAILK